MKKILAMLLTLVMISCLVACSGEKNNDAAADGTGSNNAVAGDIADKYGIDLTAAGEQKMSDERASMDVLVETRDVWLEGKMTFALDETPKTYEDFVEHIGCDASSYTYMEEDAERHYVWIADGDETAKFLAVFWETPEGWTLYSIGSTNIG